MENRLEDIQVRIERCPRKLTCWLGKESGISKNSVIRGLKPFPSGVKIYSTLLPYQFWTNVELCSHMFVSRFSVHISIILPSFAVYAIPTYS
jgi:hypothetical protein